MDTIHGGTAAALGTAAFVELSEEDNAGTGYTTESRMLDVSREEIDKKRAHVHDGDGRIMSALHYVVRILDMFVWEPLCTGLRFLQLSCLFVPVIVAVPVLWVGQRQPDRDGERSGALWWYGMLVSSMEHAGPTFIKLGQWAASRSDIFPQELCEIMSKLHSNAPAHSLRTTKKTVEAAFDRRPFDEIFAEFQEEPLGVGAIAQVYKAKLRPDLAVPGDVDVMHVKEGGAGGGIGRGGYGDDDYASSATSVPQSLAAVREKVQSNVRRHVDPLLKSSPQRVPSSYVAIKVLHPGVERTVRRDLRIMHFFASLLNAVPGIEWLSLPDEVVQFGEMMKLQLDLRIEAANLAMFRRNFRDRTTAWFPFPYTEFTTRNVLVEEFAQGIPLADFMENGGGVFQHDIASEGLDAFLRMLLLDNFVHADLHPGNIMVRFYKSAKPELSLTGPLQSASSPSASRSSSSSSGASGQSGGLDVTEQVLERLRPYRHGKNVAAWERELAKIEAEGFHPQLIFIDTGLVTQLNETNRTNFLDLFRAVAEFDGYKAGHLMCERCRQPEAVIDKEVFALKMQHLVLSVKSRTLALGNVKIGDILQQVLGMVRSHHVRLEGDFVNIVISILLLEGIGRSLDPATDLLSASLPILRQLGAQSGAGMMKQGDFSMLRIWVGLETRRFLQASVEDVERCVKYDLLSPNV
ncbi:Atypical/ABC1/ABC1-C protein kinase [Sporothrix schenckii ATCC 58251]|uniref:Atypical/ABC1/ABC1-C protein kinase n=1 Tax=Sporothrix schenckii (strain ATCC 58251 / de Perez 2211183) TaxID=1391915 RepID=U7PZ70_SPOS1|nr:Atypical/ABC1/ABC1-C protein kinase [Sporothrix schenckii ATCC 58251]